ncbi:D-alanine--D-alanine ligase [Pelagibaculum spongiae]|uniref:D-alanine--D-alanine ligase n=2 Tax=Pelagibaculum spongiae TaxID=2080658 RepID=A0A2V1H1L9_9GAMM|nr:D-alanine--D-alanine ligase [Pelagibaculum spongiae]
MLADFPELKIDPVDFGRVAVLLGGDSAEREVSLQSGAAVLSALQSQGIDAFALDTAKADWQLQLSGINRVFNALHGRGGEDGLIQGLLDSLKIPYTGSGVLGSALGMDKLRCKMIWRQLDLPTPDWQEIVIDRQNFSTLEKQLEKMPLPVMIKPYCEGSSVGMSPVFNAVELKPALELAAKYTDHLLAESYIKGGEYTVSILGGRALPSVHMETPNKFYDYDAKYLANDTEYYCPGLDLETERLLGDIALRAFKAVGCSGWGRVDFMRDSQGNFWLLEVNTIPGMTSHSLVPMAAKSIGLDFPMLVKVILAATLTGNPNITTKDYGA